MPRIPIPPPTLDPLPLTSAQVTKLADQWGGEQRAHWLQAWSDIDILARRFMESDPDHGPAAAMAMASPAHGGRELQTLPPDPSPLRHSPDP